MRSSETQIKRQYRIVRRENEAGETYQTSMYAYIHTAKVLLNQVKLVTKPFVCLCKDRNCSQYY